METLIPMLLSGQGLPVAIVTLVLGVFLGIKLGTIKTKSIETELERKENEIEYLSEENRKLREDVRSVYNDDIRDNLRSD